MILARDKEMCARCEHFSIKDHPEQAAQGFGLCAIPREPAINPLVAWNDRPCVLFAPAPQMAPREQFIRKQEAREAAKVAAARAQPPQGAIA